MYLHDNFDHLFTETAKFDKISFLKLRLVILNFNLKGTLCTEKLQNCVALFENSVDPDSDPINTDRSLAYR